jgi:hypothetical protein
LISSDGVAQGATLPLTTVFSSPKLMTQPGQHLSTSRQNRDDEDAIRKMSQANSASASARHRQNASSSRV